VYVPEVSTLGLNTPVPLARAGDQVPPVWGVPPKSVNKSTEALLEHNVIVPSFPAFGKGLTTMVIVVVTSQFAVELGVKVYVVVALLFNAGDQVPEIPLFEVVGKAANVPP
jgi:hypothetical protein